jgi:hypothetical protein
MMFSIRGGAVLFAALVLAACGAPATMDVGAIQTVTAKTVVAELTAAAPTLAATAVPKSTPPSTPLPPATGQARPTPQFNPFANLTAQQRECLIKEWGEKTFGELVSFARPPSREEEPAMGKCLGLPGAGQAPSGAQTPGAPPPGGTPPAGAQPKTGGGAFQDQTWYATSTDGLTWGQGTLLAEKASVPEVLRAKGVLWAYWVDFTAMTGPNMEKIGVAKSADGKTWEKLGNVKFANLGSKVPVDPDVVELEDGRFRLYFYDIAVQQGDHPIYSAISSDGINFAIEEGVRFKAQNIFDPDVVRLKDGRWRMFLNNDGKIISATGSDGLNFTADSGVRVQAMGSIPGSIVLADGSVRLYTCERGISAYKSADGLNFALEKAEVIRGQGGVLCDPSVTAIPSGYLMVYKVNPGK